MAKRQYLLVLGLVLIFSTGISAPAFAEGNGQCTAFQIASNTCPKVTGEIVGGEVKVGAETGVPGSGGGGGNGNGGNGNGGSTAEPPSPAWQPSDVGKRDDITVTGPITLSDLVSFRPAPGVDYMEPDGWMIVGLDTNFYARAGVQVQNGPLPGQHGIRSLHADPLPLDLR